MDSFQLRYALLKCLPIFTAVCACDQLELLKEHDSFAIIVNNEPSTENGMHWICFFKDSDKNVIEFFDSYAMNITFYPKSVLNFCNKQATHIRFSKAQFQSNLSDYCGHYCLWFLIHRYLTGSFQGAINKFSNNDLIGNDIIVKNFVLQHFNFPEFSNCKTICQEECLKQGLDFSNICVQASKQCTRLFNNLTKT